MRNITENELQEILHKHKLWVNREGGERANLSGANMSGAYLTRANMSGAYLTRANMREADLSGANMSGAYLSEADLSGAYLSGAYLSRADLSRADLSGAYLSGADLSRADLSGADLSEVDLSGAYLSGADLSGADLSGADLSGAKNVPYIPLACPEEGSFIGFKKAVLDGGYTIPVIVKLLIPDDAKRSSATGSKCRCSKAKVLDIQDLGGNSIKEIAHSKFDNAFKYKIGEVVEVKGFDENRFNECAPGIHFFINRQDAVSY